MSTFLLIHGMWHGGWCWDRLTPLLRDAGHEVHTLTLAGLAERADMRHDTIDLNTHVQEIVDLIESQNLRGVILVGHSSGMANVSAYDCSKVAVTRFTDTLAQETKEFGISVFAIFVGPARTEMMDYIIESEAGRKWLSYLPKELEGKWQSVELAGTLALALASGKYDALTGRWVNPEDDLDEMLKRIEEIQKGELFVWSVRGLKVE